jgi:drug/metabolite transporter (DMT)-like permease
VFAALAGALFLDDMLTPAAALGCVLILLAVVMVEVGPLLSRNLKGLART